MRPGRCGVTRPFPLTYPSRGFPVRTGNPRLEMLSQELAIRGTDSVSVIRDAANILLAARAVGRDGAGRLVVNPTYTCAVRRCDAVVALLGSDGQCRHRTQVRAVDVRGVLADLGGACVTAVSRELGNDRRNGRVS